MYNKQKHFSTLFVWNTVAGKMAQANSASSTVYLTMKEFPPKFESEYCVRNQSSKQNLAAERVMVAGADRRQRIMADYTEPKSGIETQGFPGIGLLRTEFNGTCFINWNSHINLQGEFCPNMCPQCSRVRWDN